MESMGPIRLYLLNSLRFETRSETRNISGIYGQLLGQVALSKIDQGRISRRELAGRLYPDVADDRAKRLLSGALYRLKRDLGPFASSLITDVEFVTLGDVWIDTLAFYEKINSNDPLLKKEAVELYSGELLPNIDHPTVHIHRHKLHEAYLRATPEVIEHLLGQNDINEALLIAHRWTLNEPFDDRAHLTTINLYLEMGRVAAAIKLYQEYAKRLERELGISPSDEMIATIQEIRQNRPPLSQPYGQPRRRDLFIGRESEINLIRNLFDRFGNGEVKAALISGEAGIGKTSLLKKVGQLAKRRQIRPYLIIAEDQDSRPFAPINDLLESIIQSTATDVSLAQLPRITQQVLSRVIPSLAKSGIEGFNGAYSNNHISLPTLKVAVYQLLELLTRQHPMILMLDDLQWIDSNGIELLSTLVESTRSLPFIVLFAFRTTESRLHEVLHTELNALQETFQMNTLSLQGLTTAETYQLATSFDIPMSDQEITTLYQQSMGNPLIIKEWIRNGKTLPDDLSALFHSRLAGLRQEERQALEIGAILGRQFTYISWLALYPRLAHLDLDPLLMRGILIEEEGGYRFENDLLREFIYQQQDNDHRVEIHKELVYLLEEQQSDDQVLAWHYEQAGEIEQAISYHVKSAREAVQHGAYDLAKTIYNRGKGLASRHGIDPPPAMRLLDCQIQQHENWNNITKDEIKAILDAAEAEGDLETVHWASIAYLRLIVGDGDRDIIREAGEQTLAAVRAMGNHQLEIATLNEIANLSMSFTYESEWAEQLANQALALLQTLPTSPFLTVTTLFTLIHINFKLRNHERAQRYAEQADYYMTHYPELAPLEYQWMHYAALIAQTKGDIEKARELHNERVKLGRVINEYRIRTASLFNSVYMARKLAQHEEMLIYAEELFQYVMNHERATEVIELHFFRAFLADCYIVVQDLEQAEKIMAPVIPWLETTDKTGRSAFSCLMTLGDLRFDQGRYEESAAIYQRIVDMPRAAGSLTFIPMLCLAQALSKCERRAEAQQLICEVEQIMDLSKMSNDLIYFYYVAFLAFQDGIYLSKARSALFENAHLIKHPKFRRDYLVDYPIAGWVYAEWEQAPPCQTATIQVPRLGTLNHKGIHADELVQVVLTLNDPVHDEEIYKQFKKSGLRRHRLKRLSCEAIVQGGALTQEELAQLLQVSLRTIERDIQQLREDGTELHTRNDLVR